MADFYILVMDQYDSEPGVWRYSKRADTEADLQDLAYYEDPPRRLCKSEYVVETITRLLNPIPPCQGGLAAGGKIYGLRHV